MPDLPPAPAPTRDDVTVAVEAERADGGLRVVVRVEPDPAADELAVVDWAGGGPWPSWPDGGALVLRWSPAVRGERLPDGQVVLHLGHGAPDDHGIDRMEPLRSQVRQVGPGLTAEARFPYAGEGVDRIDEVRVCVWDADDEPAAAGARPVGCADDAV